MDTMIEHELACIPGLNQRERMSLVLVHLSDGSTRVSLRQQTWGDGIGWYDQSSIDFAPDQLNNLRAALGMTCQANRACQGGPCSVNRDPETGAYQLPRSA